MSNVDYKRAAEALWKLLDDISTLDDACRGNETVFARLALQVVEQRHEWAKSYDGQTLVWKGSAPDD